MIVTKRGFWRTLVQTGQEDDEDFLLLFLPYIVLSQTRPYSYQFLWLWVDWGCIRWLKTEIFKLYECSFFIRITITFVQLLIHYVLSQAGVKIDDPILQVFNGQEVEVWPRIVWKPKWGLTFSDVRSKVHGNCSVTQRSTMVIKSPNCHLVDLSLNGALIIDSSDGTEVSWIY